MLNSYLTQHAWFIWLLTGAMAGVGVASTFRLWYYVKQRNMHAVKMYCRLCGCLIAVSSLFNGAMLAGVKLECTEQVEQIMNAVPESELTFLRQRN